ncbi:uncharacterized protein LOC126661907 [Mercurialis annua]|uniref:uncharacterized protein LOC126661907 n=1 Tax=Mercurialis annua TaxID=3986 RepID=UPI0021602EE1|nr:uncharacterized protein LOC126661907 [Mercurialis annua]
MVSDYNLFFIGLVESKKEFVNDFLIRKLWPNLDCNFDWVASNGASGSLIIIWNTVLLHNVSICKGDRWIAMDFFHDNAWFRHILIYASNLASERLGDFNETLLLEERLNGSDFSASMLAFRDFVNNAELLDLPLQGRLFTWHNSFSRSRIDRCLISSFVGSYWPNMSLSALSGGHSDHIPIHFREDNRVDWGPKPFRSMDAWWEHDAFQPFLTESWVAVCCNTTNLVQRSKELRHKIKVWNSEVFGNQNKLIRELSDKISRWYVAADTSLLTVEDKSELASLKADLWKAEKRVELLWIQKSRVKWCLEGDRNTKFFHSTVSAHFRNNHIASISVDDNVFSEPTDLRFHIRDFYSNLFDKKGEVNYDITSLGFAKISELQARSLIIHFEESEILSAILSCGSSKASGPDDAIESFISKIISDSFCVVSDSQYAFLKNRSILECSMIANDLVHLATRRKDKLLILKLDFHKAFDSIDWNYLLSVMRCMNFPDKWIDCMSCCLSSATTSVLVNGSPTDPIALRRGVRQADPISPYLFVIAAEGLKRLLEKSAEKGYTQ